MYLPYFVDALQYTFYNFYYDMISSFQSVLLGNMGHLNLDFGSWLIVKASMC